MDACIRNLEKVMSEHEVRKVFERASQVEMFIEKANVVDADADMNGKPACLTDEQWQRMEKQYRDFLIEVDFADKNPTDAVWHQIDPLVEKAVEVGIEDTIRADMMLYYNDELDNPLLDNVDWFEIILECDAARWTCKRSEAEQPIHITKILFLIGKDQLCNINLFHWQTRFVLIKLFTYWGQSGGNLGDEDIEDYLYAFIGIMKGWSVDRRIEKYVASWKAGKGDLAVSVWGQKSKKRLNEIRMQAEDIMKERIEKLTPAERISKRETYEFTCDFFGWHGMFGDYEPSKKSVNSYRLPGYKGALKGNQYWPPPFVRSPARDKIDKDFEPESLVAAMEGLNFNGGDMYAKITGVVGEEMDES